MIPKGTKVTISPGEDRVRQIRVKVGVWLPRELDREVEKAAFDTETSKQRIIEAALRAYLATPAVRKSRVG
jgi:predicted transcriptional regulator